MPSNKNSRKKPKQNTRKAKAKAGQPREHTQKQTLDPIPEVSDTENSLSGLPESPPSKANTVTTVPLNGPPSFRGSSRYSSQTSSPSASPNPEAYVYVPVLPFYEERGTLDGGTLNIFDGVARVQSTGVFATRTLEAGTRIICEPPLLVMPTENDECSLAMSIAEEFNNLSPPERASLWPLQPIHASNSPFISHTMKLVQVRARRLAQIDPEQLPDTERDEYHSKLTKASESGMMYRIYSRWLLNRTVLPSVKAAGETTETLAAVFPETAKLRHSCVPNCYSHFNVDRNRLAVHVTKTVEAGEELTITRLDDAYFHTAEERAKKLIEKLNILCICEACDPNHVNFSDHEKNRTAAMGRAAMLKQFASRMDYTCTEDGQALLDWGGSPVLAAEPTPSIDELETYGQLCQLLVTSLEETGGKGIADLIPWYTILMEHVLPRLADAQDELQGDGYLNKMLYYAEECEIITFRCYGEDSTEFKVAKARLEALREHVEAEREHRQNEELKQTMSAMKKMKVVESE